MEELLQYVLCIERVEHRVNFAALYRDSFPLDSLLEKAQGISELSEGVKKFAQEIKVIMCIHTIVTSP